MKKTNVVTGGTAGIGQQTAIGLARLGARVIVTGRDAERGQAGLEAIRLASGGSADVTTRARLRGLLHQRSVVRAHHVEETARRSAGLRGPAATR